MLVVLLFSFNLFAIEWNSQEFKNSLNKWGNSVNKYKENPSLIKEDITNKYKESFNNVSEPIKKKYEPDLHRIEKKLEEKGHALKYFGNRAKTYTNVYNGQTLVNNVQYDLEHSFPLFWTEFVEEVPLVVPLKLEINNKIDSLRIYPYLLRPYFNNIKYQIQGVK